MAERGEPGELANVGDRAEKSASEPVATDADVQLPSETSAGSDVPDDPDAGDLRRVAELPRVTETPAASADSRNRDSSDALVRQRWDLDERGIGTASAQALAPILDTLLEHARRDGWIAEQPEAHLLPHLRRASASGGSPWRVDGVSVEDDGTLELRLGHSGTDAWDAYQDAIRLLSVIAESAFLVRRVDEQTVECLTGMLDGDSEFAGHGHRIRLVLSVSAA